MYYKMLVNLAETFINAKNKDLTIKNLLFQCKNSQFYNKNLNYTQKT